MSIYKGTELLAGVATDTISNANYLLDFKWSDHIINSMEWLRADTFSWQSGLVYTAAYNHLANDYNNGEKLYGWGDSSYWVGTTSATPSVGDSVYAGIPSAVVGTVESVSSGSITVSGTAYPRYSEHDGGLFDKVGSYTIRYVLADDGHKITTDETNAANIYNESGVAWYYVLDTANQRFKLPRTKYGFTGLRDTVGNYVPETLPNIKGRFANSWDSDMGIFEGMSGAFAAETKPGYLMNIGKGSSSSNPASVVNFNASRSSSAYQDNAPVQQRATQMYLYFYVGQYSQSATEQTAGLNSELFNGKVDLDAANLSTAGKSLISGLGMPSNRYTNLTLLASGNTYTAPANGYFFISKNTNANNQYLNFVCGNRTDERVCPYSGGNLTPCMSVLKGQTVICYYNAGGTTNVFRFYYAEGEQ